MSYQGFPYLNTSTFTIAGGISVSGTSVLNNIYVTGQLQMSTIPGQPAKPLDAAVISSLKIQTSTLNFVDTTNSASILPLYNQAGSLYFNGSAVGGGGGSVGSNLTLSNATIDQALVYRKNTFAVSTFVSSIGGNVTIPYTSDGTFTPPAGVTSIQVQLWGAAGGSSQTNGGYGSYVAGTLNVTPNQPYTILVGGGGGGDTNPIGGTNGGGSGYLTGSSGGGGGGRSAIREQSGSDDLVTAGGGGGAGNVQSEGPAGNGGIITGANSANSINVIGGKGGTQTGGGDGGNGVGEGLTIGAGDSGIKYQGGNAGFYTNASIAGGGGGGGYFGGGGGGWATNEDLVNSGSGGGGGSSLTSNLTNQDTATGSAIQAKSGWQSGVGSPTELSDGGDGLVRITYFDSAASQVLTIPSAVSISTLTVNTIPVPRILYGSGTTDGTGTTTLTFSSPFNSPPVVTLSQAGGTTKAAILGVITPTTTTSATVNSVDKDGAAYASVDFFWTAIGQ